MRNNILCGCRVPLTFEAGSMRYRIEALPWCNPRPSPGAAVLTLRVGEHKLWLQLSRWPRLEMPTTLPPISAIDRMLPDLRLILAQAAFGNFIPVLEALVGQKIDILDLCCTSPGLDYDQSLQFKLDQGSELVLLGVFGSNTAMDMVFEALREWPQPADKLAENLSFPVRAEIGFSTISTSDLFALAPGDVVLLDPCDFLARRLIRLRIPPSLEIYLKLEQGKAMIEDIKQENNIEMPSSEPVNIDELNVTLTFDVGAQQLALHELKKIHKGYTFELSRPLNQLVTIRCNGQKIGTAELIEVEDRVGMRVVSLAGT